MKEDLETRRDALKLFGGFGLALFGCAGASATGLFPDAGNAATDGVSDAGGDGGPVAEASASCETIPDETAGPYPDKTGMLDNAAFFRQDVTEGKAGVPLALTLTVVDATAKCAPIADAIVEIWHCDKDGTYSEYGAGAGATFLRGLQRTDASGQVRFTTIYPGWYQGRATHIHIEVYIAGASRKTTQMAFPEAVNAKVYSESSLYTNGPNPMSNAADMVFGDGDALELASVAGDVTNGYAAALLIGV
jgi:protocatechuate 3,4-dioxygenase beta subunit